MRWRVCFPKIFWIFLGILIKYFQSNLLWEKLVIEENQYIRWDLARPSSVSIIFNKNIYSLKKIIKITKKIPKRDWRHIERSHQMALILHFSGFQLSQRSRESQRNEIAIYWSLDFSPIFRARLKILQKRGRKQVKNQLKLFKIPFVIYWSVVNNFKNPFRFINPLNEKSFQTQQKKSAKYLKYFLGDLGSDKYLSEEFPVARIHFIVKK